MRWVEDFRVRLGLERVARLDQFGAQDLVVLDDAVVDQRQPAGLVGVRVGVLVDGAAVGGPAGVGNAHVARGGLGP